MRRATDDCGSGRRGISVDSSGQTGNLDFVRCGTQFCADHCLCTEILILGGVKVPSNPEFVVPVIYQALLC